MAYLNVLHQLWATALTARSAHRILSQCVLVCQRDELEKEAALWAQWDAPSGLNPGDEVALPCAPLQIYLTQNRTLENLKLASGLELAMKAALLEAGYVVHLIDRHRQGFLSLSKQQANRPITAAEIMEIEGFHYNGDLNLLPGLKAETIGFSWLTTRATYVAATGFSTEAVAVADDLRKLRNQIHFEGDRPHTPAINSLGNGYLDFLCELIDAEVVDRYERASTGPREELVRFSKRGGPVAGPAPSTRT